MSVSQNSGEQCFFCRQPIESNGVQWDQTNNWQENPKGEGLIKIHLHPHCACSLAYRLVGDAFKADQDGSSLAEAGVNAGKVVALIITRIPQHFRKGKEWAQLENMAFERGR